jgi:hypothetical protein
LRTYGAKLPSSLTGAHPSTLGSSPCPRVLVLVRARSGHRRRGFSWRHGVSRIGTVSPLFPPLEVTGRWIYLAAPPTGSVGGTPAAPPASSLPLAPPASLSPGPRYGNINPLSISYAFRPRLRSRLTLGGLTCPRKPWAFGEGDFHYPLSLLVPASSLPRSPEVLPVLLHPGVERSPTKPLGQRPNGFRSFGDGLDSR